jgi:hypothetical protein
MGHRQASSLHEGVPVSLPDAASIAVIDTFEPAM